MAITTMDGLIAAIANGQLFSTYDNSLATKAGGDYQSMWQASGWGGSNGNVPSTGSGDVPTNATTGAVPFTSASVGNTMYLGRMMATSTQVGTVTIYDRLVETSGLSGTTTTPQTINSAALTRYTSGAGVQCWLEVYSPTGVTSKTASINYTGSVNGAGQSSASVTIPATTVAGELIPFTLAQGDTGVVSVQSLLLSGSTGTAGNFGITLAYDLCSIPLIAAESGVSLDYAGVGLPVIQPNACLAYRFLPNTTSTGNIYTELLLIQG